MEQQHYSRLPLVSVALCTYNGSRYLREQLQSILHQSYGHLEVVILDDHSKDNTLSIVRTYMKDDRRIRLFVNSSNLGVNRSFQLAMDKCQGEFIAVADQDDIWDREKIAVQLKSIGQLYLIYHDSLSITAKGEPTRKATSSNHRFVRGNCEKQLLFFNCASGHTCFLRRDFYQRIPHFPKDVYYDWWLVYCAASFGKLDYIKQQLVSHRMHDQSVTGNDRGCQKQDRIHILSAFLRVSSPSMKGFVAETIFRYEHSASFVGKMRLFFFLLGHLKDVFYIRKLSLFTKVKLAFREVNT